MLRRLTILWLVFFHLSAQAAGVGYACRMMGGVVMNHCHCDQHGHRGAGMDHDGGAQAQPDSNCCKPVLLTADAEAVNEYAAGAASHAQFEFPAPLPVLLPPLDAELASAAIDESPPDWRAPALPAAPLYLRTQRLRL